MNEDISHEFVYHEEGKKSPRTIALTLDQKITIGRLFKEDTTDNIHIYMSGNLYISRSHAKIYYSSDGHFYLKNLTKKNI